METKYATLRSPHFDEPRITRRASSQVPDVGIAGDAVILSVHHSAPGCMLNLRFGDQPCIHSLSPQIARIEQPKFSSRT
jgi:hypothetical protein